MTAKDVVKQAGGEIVYQILVKWPNSPPSEKNPRMVDQRITADDIDGIQEYVYDALVYEAQKQLRDIYQPELERRKKHAEHCEEWYAVRWQRLRDLFKGTEFEKKACAIMANGTAEAIEPPTYSQILNSKKAQVERLQKQFKEHTSAVGEFLSELHAILVDPLSDGETSVPEMMERLLTAARETREAIGGTQP